MNASATTSSRPLVSGFNNIVHCIFDGPTRTQMLGSFFVLPQNLIVNNGIRNVHGEYPSILMTYLIPRTFRNSIRPIEFFANRISKRDGMNDVRRMTNSSRASASAKTNSSLLNGFFKVQSTGFFLTLYCQHRSPCSSKIFPLWRLSSRSIVHTYFAPCVRQDSSGGLYSSKARCLSMAERIHVSPRYGGGSHSNKIWRLKPVILGC